MQNIKKVALIAAVVASVGTGARAQDPSSSDPPSASGTPAATAGDGGDSADEEEGRAEDEGWNTDNALLFTLPNLLQNNSGQVFGNYDGRVGYQRNLNPTRALRIGLRFTRNANGVTETTSGGTTVETVPNTTSSHFFVVSTQYVFRFTRTPFAPYLGIGGEFVMGTSAKVGEDRFDGMVTTEYDNHARTFGLGANASLGIEWRVSSSIALFAEYQATLSIVSSDREEDRETSGGTTTRSESSTRDFMELDMGIANGGALGLLAFF